MCSRRWSKGACGALLQFGDSFQMLIVNVQTGKKRVKIEDKETEIESINGIKNRNDTGFNLVISTVEKPNIRRHGRGLPLDKGTEARKVKLG